jgi:hypothetical protein
MFQLIMEDPILHVNALHMPNISNFSFSALNVIFHKLDKFIIIYQVIFIHTKFLNLFGSSLFPFYTLNLDHSLNEVTVCVYVKIRQEL